MESSEPSPFSHAILSGRPYTYLDDAPLEERRTRALSLRRGLGQLGPDGLPVPADEMAPLDPDAVATVLEQVLSPARATPTSCTTCCSRWWRARPHERLGGVVRRPGRRRPGRAGRRLLGGDGAPRGRGLARHRRRRGRRLHRRAPAAGRAGDGGATGGRRAVAGRCADGRAARRGPGAHRAGPPGRERARRSSCPTGAGVPATCWCGCTGPAGAAGAAWSRRCRSPTTCAS